MDVDVHADDGGRVGAVMNFGGHEGSSFFSSVLLFHSLLFTPTATHHRIIISVNDKNKRSSRRPSTSALAADRRRPRLAGALGGHAIEQEGASVVRPGGAARGFHGGDGALLPFIVIHPSPISRLLSPNIAAGRREWEACSFFAVGGVPRRGFGRGGRPDAPTPPRRRRRRSQTRRDRRRRMDGHGWEMKE